MGRMRQLKQLRIIWVQTVDCKEHGVTTDIRLRRQKNGHVYYVCRRCDNTRTTKVVFKQPNRAKIYEDHMAYLNQYETHAHY